MPLELIGLLLLIAKIILPKCFDEEILQINRLTYNCFVEGVQNIAVGAIEIPFTTCPNQQQYLNASVSSCVQVQQKYHYLPH